MRGENFPIQVNMARLSSYKVWTGPESVEVTINPLKESRILSQVPGHLVLIRPDLLNYRIYQPNKLRKKLMSEFFKIFLLLFFN